MKKLLISIISFLTFVNPFPLKAQLVTPNPPNDSKKIELLLAMSFSKYGCPYRYGANGKNNIYDCSSFTMMMFAHIGYKLDRTSRGQIHNGTRVEKSQLKPGDLVFFCGRNLSKRIGHVGIVTQANNNDATFHFIHASCHGVRESHSNETYYFKRYIGACRIIGS